MRLSGLEHDSYFFLAVGVVVCSEAGVPLASNWEFPKIRDTLFWGPLNTIRDHYFRKLPIGGSGTSPSEA